MARFPQSTTSIAYQIKPALAGYIKAIYWAAGADSMHRLYPGDTATTIITRGASGCTYNSSEGFIRGNNPTASLFAESGLTGLTESGPLAYAAAYFGDMFYGGNNVHCIGAGTPHDFGGLASTQLCGGGSHWTVYVPGGTPYVFAGVEASNTTDVWCNIGVCWNLSDYANEIIGAENGASITGAATTSSRSTAVGTGGNPIQFGGSWDGGGVNFMGFESAVVFGSPTFAQFLTVSGDLSQVIQAYVVPSDISGNVTLDDLVAAVSALSSYPSAVSGNVGLDDVQAAISALFSYASALSGNVTLDDLVAAGSAYPTPGLLTSSPFKNFSGTLLPNTTIPKVSVLRLSDMAQVLTLTNVTTSAGGVLAISNAALLTGTTYLLVCCSADGLAFGCEVYTAT